MNCYTDTNGDKYYLKGEFDHYYINDYYLSYDSDSLFSRPTNYYLQSNNNIQTYILHREDGPADDLYGYKEWYYHGEFIDCKSQEKFEKILKMRAFL